MIAEYLRSFQGIEIVGVAGLILALILFFVIIIRVLRTDREYLRTMSELPLDGEENHPTATKGHQ